MSKLSGKDTGEKKIQNSTPREKLSMKPEPRTYGEENIISEEELEQLGIKTETEVSAELKPVIETGWEGDIISEEELEQLGIRPEPGVITESEPEPEAHHDENIISEEELEQLRNKNRNRRCQRNSNR